MTWFQIWTVCWQVAMFVTPILLTACVLWLKSQFVTKIELAGQITRIEARSETAGVATSSDIKALDKLTAVHEGRIIALEKDAAKPPTRHSLNNEISKLQASVHSVGKSLDAVRHQTELQAADSQRSLNTMNTYLHSLIEKHLAS